MYTKIVESWGQKLVKQGWGIVSQESEFSKGS